MRTTPPPNLIGQPSVNFDLNSFEALIFNKGYDIIIEEAIPCPCGGVNHVSLGDCQNCRGSGWTFINPIQTKGILTSINNETQFKEWSQEKIGTASLTLYNDNRVSYMDRITFINDYSIFQDLKSIRTTIEDGNEVNFVFLSYEAQEIEEVFLFKSVGEKLIKLTDSQYSINELNKFILNISFDTTTIAGFNGVVSVRYKHKDQYLVIDLPHDLRRSYLVDENGRQQKVLLPVNAMVRKAHQQLILPDYDGVNVIDNSYK